MNNTGSALFKLLTTRLPIGETDSDLYILVFGIGCFSVAILIATLDIGTKYLKGNSPLEMPYDSKNWFWCIFWWAIVAFVTGMIGVSLDILQPTIAGCIGAALSWSLLVTVFTGKEVETTPSLGQDDEPGEEL